MISIINFHRDIHRVNQILTRKVEDEVIMNYMYLHLFILFYVLTFVVDPLNQVCNKIPQVLGPNGFWLINSFSLPCGTVMGRLHDYCTPIRKTNLFHFQTTSKARLTNVSSLFIAHMYDQINLFSCHLLAPVLPRRRTTNKGEPRIHQTPRIHDNSLACPFVEWLVITFRPGWAAQVLLCLQWLNLSSQSDINFFVQYWIHQPLATAHAGQAAPSRNILISY